MPGTDNKGAPVCPFGILSWKGNGREKKKRERKMLRETERERRAGDGARRQKYKKKKKKEGRRTGSSLTPFLGFPTVGLPHPVLRPPV